ncbi:NTP transferase domain-containing protein [Cellulomonas sp. SG140]|uniref:NTP transferase domain-containing protein n=1 Tax=Cellulomonas sp. SG140 TaxID=2976536 RepID=UPI0021E83F1C|nr:NTP transferase domain-containing protein [Cellulomonas sp. SG140]
MTAPLPAGSIQAGPIQAVVLTGGRGSRLGGAAKAELDLGDGPLIARLLDALVAAGVGEAVVVGPPPSHVPDALRVRVTREDPPFGGPAAAVQAAIPLLDAPWVLLLACDLPRSGDVVRLLLDRWAGGTGGRDGLVLVDDEQQPQWLAGVYAREALAAALRAATSEATLAGRRGVRMGDVVRRLQLEPVADPSGASRDVDTPEDVEWWRRRAGDGGAGPTTNERTTVEHSGKAGRVPAGALGDWLAELQGLLGIEDRINVDAVLDVARDVAHGVARPAAPLSTFALGLALGRSAATGVPVDEELERLAALVQRRALEHAAEPSAEPSTEQGTE